MGDDVPSSAPSLRPRPGPPCLGGRQGARRQHAGGKRRVRVDQPVQASIRRFGLAGSERNAVKGHLKAIRCGRHRAEEHFVGGQFAAHGTGAEGTQSEIEMIGQPVGKVGAGRRVGRRIREQVPTAQASGRQGEGRMSATGSDGVLNGQGVDPASPQRDGHCRAVFEDTQVMQAFLEAFSSGKRAVAHDDGEGSLLQVAGDALLHFVRTDRAFVGSHRDGADEARTPEIHRLERGPPAPPFGVPAEQKDRLLR